MATQSVSSLLGLPKRKRLEIAESLWLSVADDQKMPVPESHHRILDARMASYRSGKSKPIPHDELMRRVRAS
jgi:putative addiction module component (TIGR02574 family)